MAHSLTSNSFFSTTPHPNLRLALTNRRFTVFAKTDGPFSSFRFPKQSRESSSEESKGNGSLSPSGNNNGSFFNFGNLPDVKSLIPVVSKPLPGVPFTRKKDAGTVFVAGATGQAGIRIAQTLLRKGFSVRAGVPELGAAQELASVAAQYKIISNEELKRLNAVQSTFEDPESIARSIGNATKVVVTISPTENGPTTEVSTSDALQVIQAAQLAGVSHIVIIYDGNTSFVSTNNVLDGIQLFFNNIFAKSQPLSLSDLMEKVIQETDVQYTLIKTSLTDDFSVENSYNVVVAAAEERPGANDYKVSKLQIASLVADVFSNTAIAENKVVEVFTDPSAPYRKIDDLFSVIPQDGRRKEYKEAISKAKAEAEAIEAAEKAREASEKAQKAAKELDEEVKKVSQQEAKAASLAEQAQEKAQAAGAPSMESFLASGRKKIENINNFPSWEKLSSQLANAVPRYNSNGEDSDGENKASKVQVATVRGQAKALSLRGKKAVVRPENFFAKRQEKKVIKPSESSKAKNEVRNVFGGLFKQETIYIDDD